MADVRDRGESRGAWRATEAAPRRDSIFDDAREPRDTTGYSARREDRAPAQGAGRAGGGQGRFPGHRQAGGGRDALYRSWRDRQVAEFDQDYEDYCRERQQQFHQEFEQWRQNRERSGQNSGENSGSPREKTAASRPGIEHEATDTNVTGAGQTEATPATSQRGGGRRRG